MKECDNVKDLAQTCPKTCFKCNDDYECKDSKAKFIVFIPKKQGNGYQKKKISCKKTVKKNAEYYCSMEGVTYACPETCGLCDSNEPSSTPSQRPSDIPSSTDTVEPSAAPTVTDTVVPSAAPTVTDTVVPSDAPTLIPPTAFQDKIELQAVAKTWCENPDAWKVGYSDYDKYGYVTST